MKILDLFAGIGGFSLGLHRASKEFRTVAFCEQDPFCTRILNKHWPDVPVYPDIRELTYERLKADGVVADSENARKLSRQRSGRIIRTHRVQKVKQTGEQNTQGRNLGHNINNGSDSQNEISKSYENKKGKPKELAGAIDLVCGGFP